MVGEFGKGLRLIINTESIPKHDWMSYASWYSINKNLPDAEVLLLCRRGEMVFGWPYKCGVKVVYYTKEPVILYDEEHLNIHISPTFMAVRSFMSLTELGPIDAKSDQVATFVDYSKGCGKFVFNEGIDMAVNPFGITKKLTDVACSLNEVKILKLWEDCEKTYNML